MLLTLGIVIGSFSLRILERPAYPFTGKDFSQIDNAG